MKELKVTQERLSELVNLMGLIEGYLTISEGEVTDSNAQDLYFMKRSVETLFISDIEEPYEEYIKTIPKDKRKDYLNTGTTVSNYFNFKETEELVPFQIEAKQYDLFKHGDNLLTDENDIMLINRFNDYLSVFEKRRDIQVFSKKEITAINKETMKHHHSFTTILSSGARSINFENCNKEILYILNLGSKTSRSTRKRDTFTFVSNLNRKSNISN